MKIAIEEKQEISVEIENILKQQKSTEIMFKEEKAKFEKLLMAKDKEIRDKECDRLNSVALSNYLTKEKEFMHIKLEKKKLLIKNYLDAQKVHEKINIQVGKTGLGFEDLDPYTCKKRSTLEYVFCLGKEQKPDFPVLYDQSVFKRSKYENGHHVKKLKFKNITYSSGMKSQVNLKLVQKKSDIFTFGSFTHITLNPKADEFIPRHTEEDLRSKFEKDILQTLDDCITTEFALIFEQDIRQALNE